jgi:hypothetical protein
VIITEASLLIRIVNKAVFRKICLFHLGKCMFLYHQKQMLSANFNNFSFVLLKVHNYMYSRVIMRWRVQLRRISCSPRTKLLATRCECLHLIKINCLALWLDESAHASLAASCEELRARTGNPPLGCFIYVEFLSRRMQLRQ